MNYTKLLEGRRAFVTTAGQGIGLGIAVLFAQHGAQVAIAARNPQKLERALREVQQFSQTSRGYLCDLSEREQVENTCDTILKDMGGVDILVSTVGINPNKGPIHTYDEETLNLLLETNYKSGLRCMKKLVPGMLDRGFGNIIFISSIHGVQTMPTFGIYAGTKGAMNATARAAALDYARKGVRVNVICPGLILSDNMMDEISTYPEGPERNAFLELLDNMQPLAPGSVEDISNAALFLASDMSSYITGQAIMVDGGASIKAH